MSDPSPPPMWEVEPLQSGAPAQATIREQAMRAQLRADRGRRILRLVAVVAAALWLVLVVTVFVTQWQALDDAGSPSVEVPNLIEQNPKVDGWSLLTIMGDALEATWGYALVAMVAFAASLWFDDSKARDLFELLDELGGDGGDGEDGADDRPPVDRAGAPPSPS